MAATHYNDARDVSTIQIPLKISLIAPGTLATTFYRATLFSAGSYASTRRPLRRARRVSGGPP